MSSAMNVKDFLKICRNIAGSIRFYCYPTDSFMFETTRAGLANLPAPFDIVNDAEVTEFAYSDLSLRLTVKLPQSEPKRTYHFDAEGNCSVTEHDNETE
jgi:hypothetical protein